MNGTDRSAREVVRLRAVQVLLVLQTEVWLWLGPSERYWPIVRWPMYDALNAKRPAIAWPSGCSRNMAPCLGLS